MPVFETRLDINSEKFAKNRDDNLVLVDQLRELEIRAENTSDKRRPVFEKRGQLTPRERLQELLDPGMPFLRLHSLTNYLVEDPDPETSIPGGSVILGVGFISGIRCMIWVDDSGIRAGTATRAGWDASANIQELSLRHKLPLIHLVESAGVNLMEYEVELWAEAGKLFRNLARLSAAGIPTTVILHGPSTAGGAYMPGMSDYVIGIKKNGLAALGGAALVRAATGEIADERELGGTEMHAQKTGLVEYLADDDSHGISMARDVISRLGWNRDIQVADRSKYRPPRYKSEEILGVVPLDYTDPYDVREIICRVVDDSDFTEFGTGHGPSTVCVHASIMGIKCAIIGNNGPFDVEGANKCTHFLQLCDQADLPVIFLNNITGYMVGTQYEQAGMVKHGSKMIQAVTNIRVPRISLYIGASFGAGNYGMSGYAYEPDFLFSWPNASTGVMGGEQAAKTMRHVAEVAAERRGEEFDEKKLASQEAAIKEIFSKQQSAFYTSARNLDHGVIDPRDTRKVLGFALETCIEGRVRELKANTFGIARA